MFALGAWEHLENLTGKQTDHRSTQGPVRSVQALDSIAQNGSTGTASHRTLRYACARHKRGEKTWAARGEHRISVAGHTPRSFHRISVAGHTPRRQHQC